MATAVAFTIVLLQMFSSCLQISANFRDLAVIVDEANNLDTKLTQFLQDQSQYDTLKNGYDLYRNEMELGRLSGLQLVKQMADDMGRMLQKKTNALQAAVQYAEKLAQEYDWNSELKVGDVPYVNAKKVNESDGDYTYDTKYNQLVNYNTSGVHIPVEIYEGDVSILNGLAWTAGLEKIWKKNLQEEENLLWQFFGTQSGIMRIYPASRWRGSEVDLYDVRRRPWYTQGASSPKDMLILVDTSGSTHGQALSLMKQAVKSLIETLGENDFINVAHFSDSAEIVGCFNTFVQANQRNKRVLFDRVDDMQAKGMASYTKGLEFAFEFFDSFYKSHDPSDGIGARCNRIIMFLTDGGTEQPSEVFEKYNWPEKKYRIFTYAVGPTANPVAAVRWIACSNKGYFARIPAMGAIRSTVQHPTAVIARPLALSHAELLQWSNVYLDTWNYYGILSLGLVVNQSQASLWSSGYMDQANYVPVLARPRAINDIKQPTWTNDRYDIRGLGMLTTVTLPVYNRTTDVANQTILGVMGSDVTTREMMALAPVQKLGPTGYAFAINANGYIIFHPNLKAQDGYLEDPPNMDFLDVEYFTMDKDTLRKQMIDGEEGTVAIESFQVLDDELHLVKSQMTYSYTSIPGSNFSLCIVTPTDNSFFLKSANINVTDDGDNSTESGPDHLQSNNTAVLLAPWVYCNNVVHLNNKSTPSDDIVYKIKNEIGDCTESMVQHLLLDALVTAKVEKKWMSMSTVDIDARFVATNGGLTRIYPKSAKVSFEGLKDPWKAQYFQLSMLNDDWVFSSDYHTGTSDPNATEPIVMATKSITLSGSKKYKTAVVGLRLEQNTLRNKLREEVVSCADPNMVCYLLDDGAYIMLVSQEEDRHQVGQFFGDVDRVLMWALYNNSIFERNQIYDFQASCVVVKHTVSAGIRSVFVPAVFDMLTVNWWTSKLAWMYMQFNLYEFLFGKPTDYAEASGVPEDGAAGNRSCIKLLTQYHFNTQGQLSTKLEATCGNCTRIFATARLPHTNLLLLVADSDCFGICDEIQLNSVPVETTDPEHTGKPDTCQPKERYRVRPSDCYDMDKREDDTDCGAGAAVVPSLVLILLQMALLSVVMKSCRAC